MPRQKTAVEERAIIVGQPAKRPYGVRARIHLQTAGALGFVENVSVPLQTGAFLSITPARLSPWEGGKKFIVTLEGFATAAAAEAAGRRLVQALLWMAVSTDAPLRLDYLSYEPAAVFERNRSAGDTCEAFGEVGFAPGVVFGELQDAYGTLPEPNEKLLLSMEIFCAARLEASQRAIFLSLVSALEPLAEEKSLGTDVAVFVTETIDRLRAAPGIAPDVRTSLEGRVLQLRHESIRQALRRLVRETLPSETEAPQAVDEAYGLRSQLIHNGVPAELDIDIDREARVIACVIRKIYASILSRTLARAS